MKEIIEFFKAYGFHVNELTDLLLLLLCVIVILATVALICVLNKLMYIGIIYIFEDKNRLERITKNLPTVFIKLMNIYKHTRIYYILIETIFLLICLISIIWLGGIVVIGLML